MLDTTSMPGQPGCCRVAPLPPHAMQRADLQIRLLEASGPQRIISGTKATGRRCRQR
jgi:hypothetical protein